MIGIPEERAIKVATYILEKRATVRDAGKAFAISKSTVHKDIVVRLPKLNPELYDKVREILDINKKERHIRGGVATREKYKK